MTTLDLHPEELFDKAARGELSDSERALLDAHLAQCAVCRFERQVAQDFAVLPVPALDVDQLVTRALTARTSDGFTARRAPRRLGFLVAAALSLFAFGSFAAVAQWTGVLPRLITALTTREDAPAAPPTPKPQAAPPKVDAPPPPEPPIVEEPPVAEEIPSVPAPPPPPRITSRPPPPEAPPAPPPTSAELFAAGNRARLDGQRATAISTYQQLLLAFPDSVEAVQTHATLGRLLLDQGDPSGAIEQLDAYLAAGDVTLREDVLSARAQAFMRLGRERDEALAWQALLEQYPTSIHAVRARARLGALDAGP